MRIKYKKILLLTMLATSAIAAISLVSCQKNYTNINNKNTDVEKPIQYKIKEITLSNSNNENKESSFTEFINEINSVNSLPKEYNEIFIKMPLFNAQKKFTREDFVTNVLPLINKTNIDFNLNEERLEFTIDSDMTLKEMEDFLEEEFNNYYVSDKFFTQDLKQAIEKADYTKLKTGKITEQKAQENNKLTEYQNVVTLIKQWLFDQSMITISDDIKIVEINYNQKPAWSLNLKFALNNQTSKTIKLDFKKIPKNSNWDEKTIKEQNLNRGLANKLKNKWNEAVANSEFANKFENILQTLKLAILVDDQHKIASRASVITWNILSANISKKVKAPRFILKSLGTKFVIPKLTKLITSLEEKLKK
ncbi:hypothetical protein [Mycoplasma zalophi]|uniref:hypothetical protein n=1 Tax=Mycoplasma zalophi TaxID=191287 RepID=UPI001C1221F7|nr:hypothetical protein [Mycoplasma zalophi]MBU4691185.1 hypothetical protein [Mycoplasma zalophi]